MTEELITIPFHSDLHRDISLFLFNNRHLSQNERIAGVYALMEAALMEGKLDSQTLLHYAVCGFIALDVLMQGAQKLPDQLMASMIGGKEITERIHSRKASEKGKKGAEALHSKPDGSREKQEKIRQAWASGRYTSRDTCAEQECAGFGMSFTSARKALRKTPDPT